MRGALFFMCSKAFISWMGASFSQRTSHVRLYCLFFRWLPMGRIFSFSVYILRASNASRSSGNLFLLRFPNVP